MTLSFQLLISVLFLFAVSPQVAFSSTLYGSTVSSAWYCCVAPTEPYRQTEFASAFVGEGMEFPENAYYWFGEGYSSWDGTLDVKQTKIELRSTINTTRLPIDLFSGFTLNFVGAPTIINVTIDPSSSLLPLGVSFTENTIVLDVSKITARTDTSFVKLDIQLAPVPEPTPSLLYLAGLIALIAFRRVVARHGG